MKPQRIAIAALIAGSLLFALSGCGLMGPKVESALMGLQESYAASIAELREELAETRAKLADPALTQEERDALGRDLEASIDRRIEEGQEETALVLDQVLDVMEEQSGMVLDAVKSIGVDAATGNWPRAGMEILGLLAALFGTSKLTERRVNTRRDASRVAQGIAPTGGPPSPLALARRAAFGVDVPNTEGQTGIP